MRVSVGRWAALGVLALAASSTPAQLRSPPPPSAEPPAAAGAAPAPPAAVSAAPVSLSARKVYEQARSQLVQIRTVLKGRASQTSVGSGFLVSAQGHIITFGVEPTYPATNYGYIRPGEELNGGAARAVAAFVEKPDQKLCGLRPQRRAVGDRSQKSRIPARQVGDLPHIGVAEPSTSVACFDRCDRDSGVGTKSKRCPIIRT